MYVAIYSRRRYNKTENKMCGIAGVYPVSILSYFTEKSNTV